MEIKSASEILKKARKEYDKNPRNWRIAVTKGSIGGFNLYIIGPPSFGVYQLNMEYVSPWKVEGCGVKIKNLDEISSFLKGFPEYGVRPLSRNVLAELEANLKKKSNLNKIIERVLREKPKAHPQLKKYQGILIGPEVHLPRSVIKGQDELERKLYRETERIISKKYPFKTSYYI